MNIKTVFGEKISPQKIKKIRENLRGKYGERKYQLRGDGSIVVFSTTKSTGDLEFWNFLCLINDDRSLSELNLID